MYLNIIIRYAKILIISTKWGRHLRDFLVKHRFKYDGFDEEEYSENIIYIQNHFKIEDVKIGSLQAWPILRHFVWFKIQLRKNENIFFKYAHPYKKTMPHTLKSKVKKKFGCVDIDDLSKEEKDFIFFINQNGTEQTVFHDEIYHRISDPIYEELIKRYSVEKIEIITNVKVNSQKYHNTTTKLLVDYYDFELNKIFIPNEIRIALNKMLPSVNYSSIDNSVRFFISNVEFYRRILEIKKPKAVFFIGYDYSLALITAANELGIKTVDLQHGVQVGWSPVYTKLMSNMDLYKDVLPTDFCAWGEYDRKHIEKSFTCSNSHVLGFKWLDKNIDISPLLPDLKDFIEQSRLNERKVGIITLQNQSVFPDNILEILDILGEQYSWIIKRHPRYQNIEIPATKSHVIFSEDIDQLPLKKILPECHVNLTECSTSLIEANYFGVRGVCYGSKGWKDYESFIQDEIIFWYQSPADKLALNNYLDNNVKLTNIVNNECDVISVIEGIV